MTITPTMYDTATLLGVMREFEPVPSYWLDLCFPRVMNFDTEYIDFEKLTTSRKLAPFVVPNAQGQPVYSEGSEVTRLKPAYIKAKDAVSPGRVLPRMPGELLGATPMSPAQRYQAWIADILRVHREYIERRWEWMAARAVIDAAVTISGDNYPERTVDFQRDNAHSVALTGSDQWGESGVSILGNLEDWRSTVRNANFGGVTNRLTVGPDAWDVMRRDDEIREQLDMNIRGTNADLNIGLRNGDNVEYAGRIGTLDVYIYSEVYDLDGVATPFMDAKTVVLTGPNVQGVRAFGAILDEDASFQPLAIFPKQGKEFDPSVRQILSQSAPLMVPVNANNTFKAKVLE